MKQKTYERGQTVGEWTLLEYKGRKTQTLGFGRGAPYKVLSPAMWKCECSCGVIRWVQVSNLKSGQSLSCGHSTVRLSHLRHLNVKVPNSVFQLAA